MMPENLDSISEDSFPEDEPDMNFGHKIRVTNHKECHVKLEQSDIVAITSNLGDRRMPTGSAPSAHFSMQSV